MNLKKTLISILLISILPLTSAQAYRIYNQTSVPVNVTDVIGFRGMSVPLNPGESAACDPKAGGCSGKIHFHVKGHKYFCAWSGHLDHSSGHYFVISPLNDQKCTILQYRD